MEVCKVPDVSAWVLLSWAGALEGFLFLKFCLVPAPQQVLPAPRISWHTPLPALPLHCAGVWVPCDWVGAPWLGGYLLAKRALHGGCMAQNKAGALQLGRCPQP